MKPIMKKSLCIFIVLVCVALAGCKAVPEEDIPNDMTVNTDSQNETSIDEVVYRNIVGESYNKYGAKKSTAFYHAISSNNIDKDYWQESLEATTTIEMVKLENKYIAIWKAEMDYSIDVLSEFATEEQMKSLMLSQEKWKDNLDSYLKTTNDFLGESHGRSLNLYLSEECRKLYRERVFELKYYAFMIEYFHNKVVDNYRSLSFSYDSEF